MNSEELLSNLEKEELLTNSDAVRAFLLPHKKVWYLEAALAFAAFL